MPLTSPGNDDDTGENHQPTLRKNTAEPVEQTLKQNTHPETDAWLAANAMPDERLERLYRQAWERSPQGQYETFGIPARYGTGIDWNEFHTRVEWQSND